MQPLRSLYRKSVAFPLRNIDQELRPAPALVLLAVDVERATGDFPDEQIVRPKQQFALAQADRGAAIACRPPIART